MSETSETTPIDEDSLNRLHLAIDLMVASSRGSDEKATRQCADAVIHFLAVVLRGAGLPDLASAHWLVSAWQREYPTTSAMSTRPVMKKISAAVQDSLRAAGSTSKSTLLEVVKDAADRFDEKPEYRASAEARAELKAPRRAKTLCKCFGCETRFVQHHESGVLRCPRCGSRTMVETYGECLTDEQEKDWLSRAF